MKTKRAKPAKASHKARRAGFTSEAGRPGFRVVSRLTCQPGGACNAI